MVDFKQIKNCFYLGAFTSDPSPIDGTMWYRSDLGKFRKKENGTVSDLDTTGGGDATISNAKIIALSN
jgi:hypothetical protein